MREVSDQIKVAPSNTNLDAASQSDCLNLTNYNAFGNSVDNDHDIGLSWMAIRWQSD
jgi:hypothetical protein